jgi:hypothetical protein
VGVLNRSVSRVFVDKYRQQAYSRSKIDKSALHTQRVHVRGTYHYTYTYAVNRETHLRHPLEALRLILVELQWLLVWLQWVSFLGEAT